MPFVTYNALRKISSSHSIDNAYSIDFEASTVEPGAESFGNQTVSFGGNVSSVLERIQDNWDVVTVPLLYSDRPLWEEFLQSVMNKETFTFDPTGTSASPVDNVVVRLTSSRYQIRRISFNLMQISFSVRVA